MATQHSRSAARIMISPAVGLLLIWMIVPLVLTVYFSLLRYNLLMPGTERFVGFLNYKLFFNNPAFFTALINTLLLVGGVLIVTVVGVLVRLNTTPRPIANKYREGKLKRTLKREFKST